MRQLTYTGFGAALCGDPLDFASMDPRDEVVCDASITTQRRRWLSVLAWTVPLVGVAWDRVHAPASLHDFLTIVSDAARFQNSPYIAVPYLLGALVVPMVLLVGALVALRRAVREGSGVPAAEGARARFAADGVSVDGALVVPAARIALAAVAPRQTGGFAVRIEPTTGRALEISVPDEATGRAALRALGRAESTTAFEGVGRSRRLETAIVAVAAAIAFPIMFVGLRVLNGGREDHLDGNLPEPMLIRFAATYVLTALMAVVALGARRARAPVAIVETDAVRLRLGRKETTVRCDEIAKVERGEGERSGNVDLVLRDQRRVELRFEDGRPLAESELLVARIRDAIAAENVDASGPRRRVREAGSATDEDVAAEQEADDDAATTADPKKMRR